MQLVADNIWLCSYPLKLLGADIRRNVTLIRLPSNDVVVHSTAPFSPEDVAQINKIGRVRWVLDAMLDHDTFAQTGQDAFPDASFLAPDAFSERVGFSTEAILPTPSEWGSELQVIRVDGAPDFSEHVFFHTPSRTLIVADLFVNFETVRSPWMGILLRAGIGANHSPGVTRRFKLAIKDFAAFRASIAAILEWNFDRVIVGHGERLEHDARRRVVTLLEREGWLPRDRRR